MSFSSKMSGVTSGAMLRLLTARSPVRKTPKIVEIFVKPNHNNQARYRSRPYRQLGRNKQCLVREVNFPPIFADRQTSICQLTCVFEKGVFASMNNTPRHALKLNGRFIRARVRLRYIAPDESNGELWTPAPAHTHNIMCWTMIGETHSHPHIPFSSRRDL